MQEQLNRYLELTKKIDDYELTKAVKDRVLKAVEKHNIEKKDSAELIPLSLSVKDLLTIKEAEIDYTTGKIIKITGKNGKGKTLLIELPRILHFNSGRNVNTAVLKKMLDKKTYIKYKFINKGIDYCLTIAKSEWKLIIGNDEEIKTGQTVILKYFGSLGFDKLIEKRSIFKDSRCYITEEDRKDFQAEFMGLYNIGFVENIKSDYNEMITNKQEDIDSINSKLEDYDEDEGVDKIDEKIFDIEKELNGEDKLKEELLNIVTEGTDIAAKKIDEIQSIKNDKTEKQDLIKKVEFLNKNKNIFSELKKLNNQKEKQEKENSDYKSRLNNINSIKMVADNKNIFSELDKLNTKKEKQEKQLKEFDENKSKIKSKIRMLEFDRDTLCDSIKKIEDFDGKCPFGIECKESITETRKKIMQDEKQKEVDKLTDQIKAHNDQLKKLTNPESDNIDSDIRKAENIIDELKDLNINNEDDINKYLKENNIKDIKEPKIDESIYSDIAEKNNIVERLQESDIKNDSDIDKFIEKNNIESLQSDIKKLDQMLEKKEAEYQKFVETDKTERKKEIEAKLETIENAKIKIGGLQADKKNAADRLAKKNKYIEDRTKLENENIELRTVYTIFDKKHEDSFPIWFLQDSVEDFQNKVNKELVKYDATKELKIQISSDFQIKVKGLRARELSSAQEKIINLTIHITELLLKFNKIPYFAIDDYKAGFEQNTFESFKKCVENYYSKKLIGCLLLTEYDLTENVKIDYIDEV
jgi:hypothetical protein